MRELLEFENFASDADEIRQSVINGEFATHVGPDGASYTGISLHPVPHWPDRISELIGKKVIPKLSCFRLNLSGELPHSWVHSDDICAKYASVLYLNTPEQCKGGTAFWRHKQLLMSRLPTRQWLKDTGCDDEAFYQQMERDWKVLDLWEKEMIVPMKWNKFVTYPTCLFHSRYPFEAFGTGPKDGRLIWICFYDIEGVQ